MCRRPITIVELVIYLSIIVKENVMMKAACQWRLQEDIPHETQNCCLSTSFSIKQFL